MEHAFIDMLAGLEDGVALDEYQRLLSEVVTAVKEHQEDGKLQITLNVKVLEDGTVVISDKIKTGKPRKVNSSAYILGPGGVLKPQQLTFEDASRN